MTRALPDVIGDLEKIILESEEPRAVAIYVLGIAMGMALRAGWTTKELEEQGLLAPRPRGD